MTRATGSRETAAAFRVVLVMRTPRKCKAAMSPVLEGNRVGSNSGSLFSGVCINVKKGRKRDLRAASINFSRSDKIRFT